MPIPLRAFSSPSHSPHKGTPCAQCAHYLKSAKQKAKSKKQKAKSEERRAKSEERRAKAYGAAGLLLD